MKLAILSFYYFRN